MAEDSGTRRKPAEHVTELKELVIGYARQETWEPLGNLGRYLGFGIGGGLLVGVGCVFLLLALLRGLQSWGSMGRGGAMSLIPYGATIVAAVIMLVMTYVKFRKDDKKDPRS